MTLLDIGCGPNKREGMIGIDHYPFEGVDIVRDLKRGLPFGDSTIEGVHAKHILEHFNGEDLIFIVEEIWRVCMPGAQVYVEVPGLGSPNCGKDFTHVKKDWDEWSFQMWKKEEWTNEPYDSTRAYLIERGPMYGIRGEFQQAGYQFNNATFNAHYQLIVVKDEVREL